MRGRKNVAARYLRCQGSIISFLYVSRIPWFEALPGDRGGGGFATKQDGVSQNKPIFRRIGSARHAGVDVVEAFPMVGRTRNHFRMFGKLGARSMGAVCRARGQKLMRDVGINVLLEGFANEEDRIARFQREADLLASPNRTNIAAIYGMEESTRTNFLILELVEGVTLADRINVDPAPVEDVEIGPSCGGRMKILRAIAVSADPFDF